MNHILCRYILRGANSGSRQNLPEWISHPAESAGRGRATSADYKCDVHNRIRNLGITERLYLCVRVHI